MIDTLLALSAIATVFIVIGSVILVVVVAIISIYNALVALRNRVKNAWAQIDVQLKRRYDLIPSKLSKLLQYFAF